VLYPQKLRERLERVGDGGPTYAVQRAYVALMFDMIGRLLVAASETDSDIQREIQGFRDGYTIGFSVLGDPKLRMGVQVRDGMFKRLPKTIHPELEIVFKHVSHAFYVLSFRESTPRAYASERFLTNGDVALALRFMRCMNRMQAIALPRFVADRALKQFPDITPPEKRELVKTFVGRFVRGLVVRS
jgi:hypothetical protein